MKEHKRKPAAEAARKVTVAVSGGFDPIHIGHLRLFREAKKLGDELIIILNNDHWLKAKKGYIFMPEHERREILEGIGVVDRVVLSGHEPDPKDMSVCRELLALRPHVFANGGDRAHGTLPAPEISVCASIGCRMVFGVGEGGKVQSSSWLLDKHRRLSKLDEQAALVSAKKAVVFDLDGTLTESKTKLDAEMSALLCKLLEIKIVGVMGGGSYQQFTKQFLRFLACPRESYNNLFLFPTSGARLYRYRGGRWELNYQIDLSAEEKKSILGAFKKAFRDIGYTPPTRTYGPIIEDRGTQITFSGAGQRAPLPVKEKWNKTCDRRRELKAALEKYLPRFEIRLGGFTSVDVTKKGIDKAYGVRQLKKITRLPLKKMVYIGDALYEGGNDSAVFKTGIDALAVTGPEDVKYLLRKALAAARGAGAGARP